MTNHRKTVVLLRAALMALPVVAMTAVTADAQYRRDDDGRSRDASNLIGSNGYNDYASPGRAGPRVSGNQIITGNVNNGRSFRGTVNYTDPRAFRGPTAGQNSDRFIRDSAGVPAPYSRDYIVTRPQAFYGESRAVAPPPGSVRLGSTGGFVTNQPISDTQYNTFVTQGLRTRDVYDMRYSQDYSLYDRRLTGSGEVLLNEPGTLLGPDGQPMVLSASPLYGVREWRVGSEGADNYFISRFESTRRPDPSDRFRIDDASIQQMRDELNQSTMDKEAAEAGVPAADEGAAEDGADAQRTGGQQSQGPQQQPAQISTGALDRPFGSPQDTAISNNQIGANPLGAGVSTDQGVRRRLVVPPAQQSAQYAELRRRFERQRQARGDQPLTDAEANRQFQALRNAQEQGAKAGGEDRRGEGGGAAADVPRPGARDDAGTSAPGAPGVISPKPGVGESVRPQPPVIDDTAKTEAPAGMPDVDDARDVTPKEPTALTPKPEPDVPEEPAEPLQVKSLAAEVKAKGLRDLLESAEELMRAGKFESALEKYDAAEQVTGYSPLVTLGRAQAELGASYYARAENNLRRSIESDPALLMGQYDLKSFIGDRRLRFLVEDLKQLAKEDPKSVRPALLLAYIAYNTGNEAQAATYLADAEKRAAGRDDEVLKLMRRHWALPDNADEGANEPPSDGDDMNK